MQHMQKVISGFLRYLNIPVSTEFCERLISSHADFPSLLSIVDMLERLGIKHIIAKIDPSKLNDLPMPYLLQTDANGGAILAIKSKRDLVVNKESLEHWNGIVLQVEPTTVVSDEENNRLYKKEKFVAINRAACAVAIGSLFVLPHVYTLSPGLLLLQITSIMGMLVGYLLVAKELGIKYDTVESFCASGKSNDCDAVLNSEGAKFGAVKLSDAVLSYFIFQCCFVSVGVALDQVRFVIFSSLSVLSVLLIPVVLYSLYYQHFRAKTWCRLCLVVDGILIVQAAILGYLIASKAIEPGVLSGHVILVEALCFAAVACAVIVAKNSYDESGKQIKELTESARIKNNAWVFTYLLQQQRKINPTLMDHEITIGHEKAPVQIIMVSNLYCNPCKEQHHVIEKLMTGFPGKINVALRFVVSKDEITNHYLILYWLKYIHRRENESHRTRQLIHDWYSIMDLDEFKKLYPLGEEEHLHIAEDIERRHRNWINHLAITMTPTFFVNGYQLPKEYSLQDLSYLIPSLAHNQKSAALPASLSQVPDTVLS